MKLFYSIINKFLIVSCIYYNTALFAKDSFQSYWFKGKAEISAFKLKQARYGSIHQGKLYLIFVTENFLKGKQVKDESYSKFSKPVLKLNYIKKFPTGIYDYSTMTSIFTPINQKQYPHSFKVTMSSQEWCGHVYTQLNLNAARYLVRSHSYFEQEADKKFYLPKILLEDELLNYIRLNPNNLPIGKDIHLIPSLLDSRLRHYPLRREKANITLVKLKPSIHQYIIQYTTIKRKLVINFESEFPYKISKIEEHLADNQITIATRINLLEIDYWNKNKPNDIYNLFK